MTNFFINTKVIPTTLDFLNRKYVDNYYENQVRFLEAIGGQFTHSFKFRLTISEDYDGD